MEGMDTFFSRSEPAGGILAEPVVVRLSALGDVALMTGVLEYWRRTYGWTFTVITRQAFAPVLEGHPAVRRVIGLSREDLALPRQFDVFRDLAEAHAGRRLIDLHGTMRTRLLSALWKGPVSRYAKLGLERRLFLWSKGKLFGERLRRWNVPQRYALAVERVAPPREALLPHVWLSPEEEAGGRRLLEQLPDLSEDRPVALHPYATHPDKAWKEDHWTELMGRLEDRGVPWIVIGRGKEMDGIPAARNYTNRTSLRETCALLRECRVLITGDSGPMHLAGAVGTPVLALFGPTTREWGFFPAGPRDRVLEVPLACRPCSLHGKSRCARNHACLYGITPEQVMRALEGYL